MKHRLIAAWAVLAVLALLVATCLSTLLFACGGGPEIFPDPNLEAVVRQLIGKPEGRISPSDFESVTALDAMDAGIADLTGLEHCAHLTWLNLSHNQISDISPLSGLSSLEKLDLGYNAISDASPLSDLSSLKELDLRENEISDLKPLVDGDVLASGDRVELGGNPLSATSMDGYIPQLRGRGVAVSWITNFPDPHLEAPIRQAIGKLYGPIYTFYLEGLTELHAEEKNITGLAGLEQCANLRLLWLSHNQISDISPLSNLTTLKELDLLTR